MNVNKRDTTLKPLKVQALCETVVKVQQVSLVSVARLRGSVIKLNGREESEQVYRRIVRYRNESSSAAAEGSKVRLRVGPAEPSFRSLIMHVLLSYDNPLDYFFFNSQMAPPTPL